MASAPTPDAPSDRHWTAEEYFELDDEQRYELLRGDLIMVPSPSFDHQRAITQLGRLIDNHVRRHDLGECVYAPFDVVLSDDTVVQPDFSYVRRERFDELYDGHGFTGPPDLVVEVISPGTESRDRHVKRQLYAEAGVEWLLLVDPDVRVVEVFRLDDQNQYVLAATAADDESLTFDLFPDLEIDLAEVWFEDRDEKSGEASDPSDG